jgi:hypothetical protein
MGGVLGYDTGYEAVAVASTGCQWGGLKWPGNSALLDGSSDLSARS